MVILGEDAFGKGLLGFFHAERRCELDSAQELIGISSYCLLEQIQILKTGVFNNGCMSTPEQGPFMLL